MSLETTTPDPIPEQDEKQEPSRMPLGALQTILKASILLHEVWDEAIECVANLEEVCMENIDDHDRPLIEGTSKRLDTITGMFSQITGLLGCSPDESTGEWVPEDCLPQGPLPTWRTVVWLHAHGGHGMSNDGEDLIEPHYGYTQDDLLWYDSTYLKVGKGWDGDWRDVDAVMESMGDPFEANEHFARDLEKHLLAVSEEDRDIFGGKGGILERVWPDTFWDRAPKDVICPTCGETCSLDEMAQADDEWPRGVIRVQGTSKRHWLYRCKTHGAVVVPAEDLACVDD